jgi:hypothetical protein
MLNKVNRLSYRVFLNPAYTPTVYRPCTMNNVSKYCRVGQLGASEAHFLIPVLLTLLSWLILSPSLLDVHALRRKTIHGGGQVS